MAAGWQSLSALASEPLEKRFGRAPLRLLAAAADGAELPPTWLLEKKAFRRALGRVLPPGHAPLEILGVARWPVRRVKAARAYGRLLAAESEVPELRFPERPARCLVWSSPALKPRGLSLGLLARSLVVEPEEVARATATLWAGVYFEHVLRAVPSKARRVELAVGVTALTGEPPRWLLELLEPEAAPAGTLLPLPGQGPLDGPVCEFDRSLALRSEPAVRAVLAELGRAVPRELYRVVAGRPGVAPDTARYVERAVSLPQLRGVAADLVGEHSAPTTPPLGDAPHRWLRLAGRLVRQLTWNVELRHAVERQEAEMQERRAWLSEMDLGILPDDGLRRTFEELLGALERATTLAARAVFSASQSARVYGSLTGVATTDLDAGLELPLGAVLIELERTAEVLRSAPGEHERRRALAALAAAHPALFGGGPRGASPALVLLERLAARGPVDIARLRQRARVEADLRIAEREAEVPRWAAPRLAPIRQRACEALELAERARQLEVELDSLLRRVALDVDRRLPRLEPGLGPGAVWVCALDELMETVDLRGSALGARTVWRAAERARTAELSEPFLGAALPSTPREPTPRPLTRTLAEARGLTGLAALLYAPDELVYAGRPTDSLPLLARSLGIRLGPAEGGISE